MRYMRKEWQVEAFRIARVVRSGPIVEVQLESDPRSKLFSSGYDGCIRLPAGIIANEGDYLVREHGIPDLVIPQDRFNREYAVIGDGSTHSNEPLFAPPTEPNEK